MNLYTRFVWWLYDFWHGKNHTIEREPGDEDVYQRVVARNQKQVERWAHFWNVD